MSKDKTSNEEGAADVFEWPPLESDPTIFTEYLVDLGMNETWQFWEVFGLDKEMLDIIPQPAVACIAAIDRVKDDKPGSTSTKSSYYMKQTGTLDNACGIIACLHAVYNNQSLVDIKPNSILDSFLKRVGHATPDQKASLLEGYDDFKEHHKTYAMEGQSALATEQSQVPHHYVCFVVNEDGDLIELDGTKAGPALIKKGVEKSELLYATSEEMQRRLNEGFITDRLSIMVLCKP